MRLGQRIVLARSLLAGQVAQETEPGGRAAQEVAAVHAFIACTLERREHSHTIRGQYEHRQHLCSRQGRKRYVGAYVPPDVARQLRVISRRRKIPAPQALIEQAIEMLFRSRARAAR